MDTRKYSNEQEKHIAKLIGGKKQANSGATTFNKADIVSDYFAVECKTAIAEKKSFAIKKEWLDTLEVEARAMRKPCFALAFNFGGLGNNENFYIINEKLFDILNKLLELQYTTID